MTVYDMMIALSAINWWSLSTSQRGATRKLSVISQPLLVLWYGTFHVSYASSQPARRVLLPYKNADDWKRAMKQCPESMVW